MEKINVAEILRGCPSGMELDCTNYNGVVTFEKVTNSESYPINILIQHKDKCYRESLTKYGQSCTASYNKCVIFPKGKENWEDFVPPCNFKDGDIVSSRYGNPFILKANFPKSDSVSSYCALDFDDNFQEGCNKWTQATGCRYATEEEKQKLFDVIKANGYKWNAETKILEKLEDVDDKGNISDGYHTFNELYEYRLLYNASMFNELAKQGLYDVHKSKRHSDGTIPFGDENWFIVQAELPTGQISNHYEMKEWDLFNIPEKEKANPYDGHTPQDVAKRLRDFLSLDKLIKPKFKVGDKVVRKDGIGPIPTVITDLDDEFYQFSNDENSIVGVFRITEQDNWELVPNKFDISTLIPFESKVLVRDNKNGMWKPAIFGCYVVKTSLYYVLADVYWKCCIPYKNNEHLSGTTNDCDEFYKTWEE